MCDDWFHSDCFGTAAVRCLSRGASLCVDIIRCGAAPAANHGVLIVIVRRCCARVPPAASKGPPASRAIATRRLWHRSLVRAEPAPSEA